MRIIQQCNASYYNYYSSQYYQVYDHVLNICLRYEHYLQNKQNEQSLIIFWTLNFFDLAKLILVNTLYQWFRIGGPSVDVGDPWLCDTEMKFLFYFSRILLLHSRLKLQVFWTTIIETRSSRKRSTVNLLYRYYFALLLYTWPKQ